MVKLLAKKYNGIACEENYHELLIADLSREEFPCLTYTRDLKNWSDFIRRTPDEYENLGKWMYRRMCNFRTETIRKIRKAKHKNICGYQYSS